MGEKIGIDVKHLFRIERFYRQIEDLVVTLGHERNNLKEELKAIKPFIDEHGDEIKEAADRASKKYQERYREASDAIDKKVNEGVGKESVVQYSAYETTEDGIPIDNLSDVPIEGKIQLRASADDYWGGENSEGYISPIVDSPTWLEIAVLADEMIRKTRDRHHSFLEGIHVLKEEDGVKICRFSMGS